MSRETATKIKMIVERYLKMFEFKIPNSIPKAYKKSKFTDVKVCKQLPIKQIGGV